MADDSGRQDGARAEVASHVRRGRDLTQRGRYGDARAAFEAALAADAGCAAAVHGLAVLRERRGDLDGALALCDRALELDDSYALALVTKGTIHGRRGERGTALLVCRELRPIRFDPVLTGYFLRVLGGGDFLAPLTHEIVDLFEDYAETFDAHLLEELAYKGHTVLCEVVLEVCGPPAAEAALDVLDLGCGTGLCGPELRPLARHLAGVDIARAMLDKAAARGVYDVLYASDLVYALALCQPESLDLLTSADCLGYVGDLAPVVQESWRALRPGGRLAFSVEAADGGEVFHMTVETRRCRYPEPYLRRIAADHGFTVERLVPRTLRVHPSGPVAGYVVVMRKGPGARG